MVHSSYSASVTDTIFYPILVTVTILSPQYYPHVTLRWGYYIACHQWSEMIHWIYHTMKEPQFMVHSSCVTIHMSFSGNAIYCLPAMIDPHWVYHTMQRETATIYGSQCIVYPDLSLSTSNYPHVIRVGIISLPTMNSKDRNEQQGYAMFCWVHHPMQQYLMFTSLLFTPLGIILHCLSIYLMTCYSSPRRPTSGFL